MYRLDLTLPGPEANLALDEALLDWAGKRDHGEFLRLWESPEAMVVVGRASRIADEVDVAYCQLHQIPVLRRPSGGAAVVAGPGCLMYAVVLDCHQQPQLSMIDHAHAFVLSRLTQAVASLGLAVSHCGNSDLVWEGRKISGNSLRVKRNRLLYHGTLLYDFDLRLVGQCLRMPPRQPAYREGRHHDDFLANLPLGRDALKRALEQVWEADKDFAHVDDLPVDALVNQRYGRTDWNYGR